MTLERFQSSPWENSHAAYSSSPIAVSPAPEYASSEVLLSSLYRHIGFEGSSEGKVPEAGKALAKKILTYQVQGKTVDGAILDPSSFEKLVQSVLESPKLPNQSSKRFIQATPLVPQIGIFSGSARLTSNSWPAGLMIKRMVWLGSQTDEDARSVWEALYCALSVSEDDDILAKFLQAELGAWAGDLEWKYREPGELPLLADADTVDLSYPARTFVNDLKAIIETKGMVTRRQWTSLLESILRIGSVSHVVWVSDVQSRIWQCIKRSLDGSPPHDTQSVRRAVYPRPYQFLVHGDHALPNIKDRVAAYLKARLGINTALWQLEGLGISTNSLSDAKDIEVLCQTVFENRKVLNDAGMLDGFQNLCDRHNRALLCKKGIGSNMMEFARHVLGQRQAASPVLRGYDQGYVLRKSGKSNNSPWVVSLGPVAVLALVHCSLAGTRGMRSIHRLSQHLQSYGLRADHTEIGSNDLGHQLRLLGLVLDSPDAESGMLLVPPFPAPLKESK